VSKHAKTVRTGLDAAALAAEPVDHEAICFRDCDFRGADFGTRRFVDCVFEDTNLTEVRWRGATLNGVAFKGAKLLGADLAQLRTAFLSLSFEDTRMDYANLGGLGLAKTRFVGCSLVDVGFVNADLSGAVFVRCDLSGAVFRGTNLSGADLRGAEGFVIDPEANKIQKAKVSVHGLAGFLTRYKLEVDV
jgi:uncharacterized protein YjbI with pentapeptide repeats